MQQHETNPARDRHEHGSGVGQTGSRSRRGDGKGRRLAPALLGLLVAVAAGCASLPGGGAADDPFDPDAEEGNQFTLAVENNNFNDARIYTRWNGSRTRIGEVTGNSRRNFDLEIRSHDLRIEVDFIAGGDFVSRPFSPRAGETIRFRIPSSAR